MKYHLLFFTALLNSIISLTQNDTLSSSFALGMKQPDFLYAGEWQNSSFKDQQMFIVKDGKIVWSYTMPWEGEYGDATLLSNGDILFSRFHGASEVTSDKKIVWNYDAPANCEIHTSQPLGNDKVFLMLNMVPAKAIIMNKKNNSIVGINNTYRRNCHTWHVSPLPLYKRWNILNCAYGYGQSDRI